MIVDGIQKSSILIDQISILLLEVRNFTHPRDECPKWLGYLGETPFCYVSFGYIELLFCRLGPKNSSRSGAATFQQTKGLLKRRGIMVKKHSLGSLFWEMDAHMDFMILWMYILYTVWYTLWFALNVPFTCQWIPQGSSEAYVFTRCREGSGGVKVARIHLRDQSKENQIGGVRGSTVVVLWTRVVPWISYRSSISIVASTLVAEPCGFARPFFWWWLEG